MVLAGPASAQSRAETLVVVSEEGPATLDIRSAIALERLGGPFEEYTRSAEVRRIATGRGLHNLPNVGLFLWRTRVWRASMRSSSMKMVTRL